MNTNKFKILLGIYAIGVTGCNKIGNPSYMMEKDDDKTEESARKRQEKNKSDGDSVLETTNPTESIILEDPIKNIEKSLPVVTNSLTDKKKSVEPLNKILKMLKLE